MKHLIIRLAAAATVVSASGSAAKSMDGLTPQTAVTSAKHLAALNPFAVSGNYFVDPDGPGGNAPVETFFDMDGLGGGWTLVLETANAAGLAAALLGGTSMLSLTETAGSVAGKEFSLDVSALTASGAVEYRWDYSWPENNVFSDPVILEFTDASPDTAAGAVGTNGQVALRIFIREGKTPVHDHPQTAPIPLPAAGWLLIAALGGVGLVRRRTRA